MVLYERSGDDIDRGLVGYWKLDDLRRKPRDGIVAHYKMNDNAASTDVLDSKGGNTGTAAANTSGKTGVGKINEALSFNGTSDKIDATYIPNQASAFSFAAWINPTDFDTNAQIYNNANSTNDRAVLSIGTSGTIRGGYFNGTLIGKRSSSVQATGSFIHVVYTFDGTNGNIYINGSLDNDGTSSAGTNDGNELRLGVRGSTDWFTGAMDDVRIYDRVLSASEASTIYNSGTGTETTELFRDTIVAIDRANFNDGTITGATNTDGINGQNPDAMFFDGVDDFVEIPHNANQLGVNLTEGFTISAWINPTSTGEGGGGRILDKSSAVSGVDGFEYRLDDVSQVLIKINAGAERISAIGSINFNEWNHVLVTVSASALVTNYVNGVLSGTPGTSGAIAAITTTNAMRIGNRSGSTNETFDGSIQKLRIYNRVLTAGEASKLHRLRL